MNNVMNAAGVYKITCAPTGKIYIGSAVKFRKRWNLHQVNLRKGTHHSRYLQSSWSKYGADAFTFEPLLICDASMVLFYEQIMLNAYSPEFNTAKTAGSNAGTVYSEETKQKFSKAQRGWRKKYEWKGRQLCLSDIADLEGFDAGVLISRVNGQGMTVEQALTQEKRIGRHELTHDGRTQTIKQWADELDMHPRRVAYWVDGGMSIGDCIMRLAREEKKLSFSQFCKHAGVNLQTAKSRVQGGMGVMDAITIPSRQMDNSWRNKEVTHG